MNDLTAQLALFLLSLVTNGLSAFAGGGSGFVQLPLLIFLGLPFSIALATHKLATVALGIGASIRHAHGATFDRKFILLMLLCGVPGVLIGAQLVMVISGRTAEIVLGVVTAGLGIYSAINPELGQHNTPSNRHRRGYIIGATVLFALGIFNGSLSSGTGLLVNMWLVRWFGLDYLRAVAHTMVLVGLFWNGSGALVLGMLASIQWSWLPALLAGALIGGYFGAHLAIRKGNKAIKRTYEVITLLLGIKLIIG